MVDIGSFFSSFNLSGIFSNVLNVVIIVIVVGLAGLAGYFAINYNKKQVKGVIKEILWWEEVQDRMIPIRSERVEEITIPGTALKVFYSKENNAWYPRFTNGLTKDMFYIAVTKNKELINFTLKSLEKDLAKAGLDYDHTDMRWPAENLREFVKRNYRDKAVPWWKLYQNTISTAVLIMVMTFSFIIIIYFMRGMVQDLSGVTSQTAEILQRAIDYSASSGIRVASG